MEKTDTKDFFDALISKIENMTREDFQEIERGSNFFTDIQNLDFKEERMREINGICYNWFYGEEGEEFEYAEVGKKNVIEIEEHVPQWAGDRFYYDIFYKDGGAIRVFNINLVDMRREE